MRVEDLSRFRVLPVVTPYGLETTLKLVEVLHRAGMEAVEITLRSPEALECIRVVAEEMPDILVGAGTVRTPDECRAAADAGAAVIFSPGATPALLDAAEATGVPFLPGVATPSEIMACLARGYTHMKCFPISSIGGIEFLRSMHGPLSEARFCPTGDVTRDTFRQFLALPNVFCCGGTWMVSEALVTNGRWDEIERLARETVVE